MNYLVYDTQNPCAFFKKVTKYFLDSIKEKINLFSLINKILLRKTDQYTIHSQNFMNLKVFICKSSTQNCPDVNKTVILSNVQVKFFLKVRDDTYEDLKEEKDSSLLLLFQVKFYTHLYLNLDHVKIISDSGKIDACEPVMAKFQLQKISEIHYEQIVDNQTDIDFFKGIAKSIKANDIVKYITDNQNPSPGYDSFLAACENRITPAQHDHCSRHTKPGCELLRKV
jgi:hypothetical protein